MKVLNVRRRKEYERAHPDAGPSLRTWWDMSTAAEWARFEDVRGTFASADHVSDRVIFNIRGGYYRLVTWIDYGRGVVVMKWFGTHEEYMRGDWR